MKIIFLNKQRKYQLDLEYFRFVVNTCIKFKTPQFRNFDNLELFISFVSSDQIRKLKFELFNLDIVTDVISVPMDTETVESEIPTIFGEIFICPQVAQKQAKEYGNSLRAEITLLIIHGFLHLIGYKDTKESEQKEMRFEEGKMLDKLEMETK